MKLFWTTFSSYAYMVYPSLSVYARPPNIQTLTIGCYDLKEPRWVGSNRNQEVTLSEYHKDFTSHKHCIMQVNTKHFWFFRASRIDWWRIRNRISAIKNYKGPASRKSFVLSLALWRCPGKSWPSDGTPVHDRRPTGAANKKCRCCQGLGHFQTFSVEVNPSWNLWYLWHLYNFHHARYLWLNIAKCLIILFNIVSMDFL